MATMFGCFLIFVYLGIAIADPVPSAMVENSLPERRAIYILDGQDSSEPKILRDEDDRSYFNRNYATYYDNDDDISSDDNDRSGDDDRGGDDDNDSQDKTFNVQKSAYGALNDNAPFLGEIYLPFYLNSQKNSGRSEIEHHHHWMDDKYDYLKPNRETNDARIDYHQEKDGGSQHHHHRIDNQFDGQQGQSIRDKGFFDHHHHDGQVVRLDRVHDGHWNHVSHEARDDFHDKHHDANNEAAYVLMHLLEGSNTDSNPELQIAKNSLRSALRARCIQVDICIETCPKKKNSCPSKCKQTYDKLDVCEPKKCKQPKCGRTMPPKW